MRPLALFAALDVEASILAGALGRSKVESPGILVCDGDIEGKPVVLGIGGVGKVAAAITSQFLCDAFQPAGLIGFGLAGAAKAGAPRGQVIVASGAVQHDMDARPLTSSRGEIPGLGGRTFESDGRLAEAMFHAARSSVERPEIVRRGLVLTGDQIVTAAEVRDRLAAEFPDAACIDMETAAVAQVAHQNGLPWGAVRVTSDSSDETFDLEQVLEFGAQTAGELFERVIRAVVRSL